MIVLVVFAFLYLFAAIVLCSFLWRDARAMRRLRLEMRAERWATWGKTPEEQSWPRWRRLLEDV